ncbi:hypothetical protein LHK_01671 [Laribacter hongkongensis HLHK9]|uniref:Uncharacterized protein n=1 Tax=Laribacter hongkongensis (strain HLHK9) TaxID=557598 RepID=C1D866_LARHH|nr:hypothetical protein [Laribacter hongkongensis]ACO74656.1 hypothetical protein LHK_01671 [Laribacter hongkongensis HLHK9]
MSSYRDPTFEIVAGREAAEQRRRARQAEIEQKKARQPNTERWIKRLRIRELTRRAMSR